MMHAAEGNGPVSALTTALLTALYPYYPELKSVHLVDYRVRLLDTAGESSITRVIVKFEDEQSKASWVTVGAHTSIVEASFRAIADGLEFGIVNCGGSLDSCTADWLSTDDKEGKDPEEGETKQEVEL